jgi:hypothetical protein
VADTQTPDDRDTVANHTLAHLRSQRKKIDLILETLLRHSERFMRLERSNDRLEGRLDELRSDVHDTRSDIALLENKLFLRNPRFCPLC